MIVWGLHLRSRDETAGPQIQGMEQGVNLWALQELQQTKTFVKGKTAAGWTVHSGLFWIGLTGNGEKGNYIGIEEISMKSERMSMYVRILNIMAEGTKNRLQMQDSGSMAGMREKTMDNRMRLMDFIRRAGMNGTF